MRSRPELGWSDLAGAKVGLWGIGAEGHSSWQRLRALGVTPVLVDDQPPEDSPLGTILPTAAGGLEQLATCEVVIKAPGISRYRPDVRSLQHAGTPITGGLALWLYEADRARVVCVTGTKGKSTTVSILGHLARGLGYRVFIGGNLGAPPFDVSAPVDVDLWVVETSSYQATDVAVTPPVAAVTSLSPDHLPWHGDVDTYYRDKLSLTSQPGADLTVVNGTDPELRARESLLGPRREWVAPPMRAPAWVERLGLAGRHNVMNALIAQRCLVAVGVAEAADPVRLREVSGGFAGLDSRLQAVGRINGVDLVDDSLSTNVLSTIAALDTYPDRSVALLAGGDDRGIDYRPLGRHLADRSAPSLLLALPSNGPKIAAAVRARDPLGDVAIVEVAPRGGGEQWLRDAVGQAFAWAQPHAGVVLLSPAAASFDHFRDYRHRSEAFVAAMHELSRLPGDAPRA